jgi:hypothetical protein
LYFVPFVPFCGYQITLTAPTTNVQPRPESTRFTEFASLFIVDS